MRAAFLIALALLCGCKREPDFDERYDAASKEIGATAKEIDAELERRATAAGTLPERSANQKVQE